MSSTTFFVHECPTCGRTLRVRVVLLGRQVACPHCQARFIAYDPEVGEPADHDSGSWIMKRADELLAGAPGKPDPH